MIWILFAFLLLVLLAGASWLLRRRLDRLVARTIQVSLREELDAGLVISMCGADTHRSHKERL